jgi:anti-sigma regulatory factor (Ser/Thr protein kinase)
MKQLLLIDIDPAKILVAAEWVERHSRSYGLSQREGYEIKTCVVEAINNAFEHGYDGGHGKIQISAWRDDCRMRIQIADHGTPADPPIAAQAIDDSVVPSRGRGWMIIAGWMDEARLCSSKAGNVVHLSKRLPG